MKARDLYPRMWQFLGAYLHVDWVEFYTDPWQALADFFEREQPWANGIGGEIESILALQLDELSLRKLIVEDLGSGYLPRDTVSLGSWLQELLSHVNQARGGADASSS